MKPRAARRDREGRAGRDRRQVSRPVQGRLVSRAAPARPTNMNANEVLANIGLELSGHKKGEYQFLDPHDDLNMSQSTNDSYPTAIKVALLLRNDKLIAELQTARRRHSARRATQYIDIAQDGPHRAAGRRADDRRPGIPCVRGVARRRDPAAARSGEAPLRGQHGRDRDRHRHQRAEGLRAEASPPSSRSCTGKPIVPATDMFAATWDQQGFVVVFRPR